ncbi:Fructose-bisphosphate aldolase 1 [Rhizina undulata]
MSSTPTNVTSSSTIVASLEAARNLKLPLIIQGVSNTNQFTSIQGCIAAAHYIRSIAPFYGIPVYFADHGEPLFTLHMINRSKEEKDCNIATTWKYLDRAAPMKQWLKMELTDWWRGCRKSGLLAGEDGGVDDTGVNNSALYTQPEDISLYTALSPSPPTSQSRRASETPMRYTSPAMLIDATNIVFIGAGEAYAFGGLVHLFTQRGNTLAPLSTQ